MIFRFTRNEVDEFAASLSEGDRREILRESAVFERTGSLPRGSRIREATRDLLEGLPARPNSPAVFFPILVNAVHRFYSMGLMEGALSAPDPWAPGQPVTADTHVRGRDFRSFYEEGWDPQWWHDDTEITCEDEFGTWVLPDDGVYPLEKLGSLAWQGEERASDWTGRTRSTGEMIPIWRGFSRWAAGQGPAPSQDPKCAVAHNSPAEP